MRHTKPGRGLLAIDEHEIGGHGWRRASPYPTDEVDRGSQPQQKKFLKCCDHEDFYSKTKKTFETFSSGAQWQEPPTTKKGSFVSLRKKIIIFPENQSELSKSSENGRFLHQKRVAGKSRTTNGCVGSSI